MLKDKTSSQKSNYFLIFIKNENGTILLPFIIFFPIFIGLLCLSFEISHFIQKKARLSDAIEQATLALTVENHNIPDDIQAEKNNIFVSSYVHAYLPLETFSDPKININNHGDYIKYNVTITMKYPVLFLNKMSLLTQNSTIETDDNAAAKRYLSIKPDPTDVVFVTDYSGSMDEPFKNSDSNETKIEALRRIFINLRKKTQDNDGINMVGFVPFSWGTKYTLDSGLQLESFCHFPYVPVQYRPNGDYLRKYTVSGLKKFPGLERLDNIDSIKYSELSSEEYDRIGDEIEDKVEDSYHHQAVKHLDYSYDIDKFITILDIIESNIDYSATIDSISGHGKTIDIPISDVLSNGICLKGSDAYIFDRHRMDDSQQFNVLENKVIGGTLISSGMLAGNNVFKEQNNHHDKLMIILSDGDDSDHINTRDAVEYKGREFFNVSKKLIDMGMCERIKDNGIKMVFIAIGFEPRDDIDWKKCVGVENFYLAHNAHELEIDIKQVLVPETEVGRNIPKN